MSCYAPGSGNALVSVSVSLPFTRGGPVPCGGGDCSAATGEADCELRSQPGLECANCEMEADDCHLHSRMISSAIFLSHATDELATAKPKVDLLRRPFGWILKMSLSPP